MAMLALDGGRFSMIKSSEFDAGKRVPSFIYAIVPARH